MLDIKFIRENLEEVKKAVKVKGLDLDLDKLIAVDEQRRNLQTTVDELRKQRKSIAQQRDANAGRMLKSKLKKLENELHLAEEQYLQIMLRVPNIPSEDTPVGGESDYKVVREWGNKQNFDFPVKDHVELGTKLNIMDLERGVKVAGYRGYFLKNEGVLLHLGILNLALQKLIKKGFTPLVSPTLIREFALIGSGHFPFGREEIYEVEEFEKDQTKEIKYLAGTSEPSLLAYHAGETLNNQDLPVKLCAISQCYRREVGGYGKDTKGLYRVHEFMKVEQVVLCKNDLAESEKWFQDMSQTAEEFLQDLKLPHRVIQIATGDMGAGKYKMYDIETWMPGRGAYGETHSNSNLTDWQTRRLNIKYKDKDGKTQFAYALNNTMIASPRILIALLENNQQSDGSVLVPKILQPFTGKEKLG